jgi:PAS domain S-box-containing protein
MNELSIISLGASIAFLGLGALAIQRGPRISLNRLFATLCGAYALWAFGFAFLYSASSPEECFAWDRLASVGFAFYPALSLHCCLLMARGTSWYRYRKWTILAYVIGFAVFARYPFFKVGVDLDYVQLPLGWAVSVDRVLGWFIFYQVYVVISLALALLALANWLRKTQPGAERKQALAVMASCLAAVLVGFLVEPIFEAGLGYRMPPMGPIVGLVWAMGIFLTIWRHRLMDLSYPGAAVPIVETVQDLLLLVTPEGTLADANRAAVQALGFDREELRGAHAARILGTEDRVARVLVGTLEPGTLEFPMEMEWHRRDGSMMPIWLWASPVHDAHGGWNGAVLVGRDLSERRRAQEEMVRASGVSSTGLLAAGAAHDFNNLLTGIMGNLELAQESPGDPELVGARLDDALAAAAQARQLALRLLSFYRGPVLDNRLIDLGRLVRESAPAALRGSDTRLELRIAPDVRPVLADEGPLVQVLHNLLINASQAMSGAGTVTVEVMNCPEAPATGPGDPCLDPGPCVCMSVSDNGPGIPADLMPRMFEPFFTTKSSGTGLGLASSRSIVRRLGGTMSVASDPGSGATFRIALPWAELAGQAGQG